jgi:YhcH/YjgK/YiaL family protein
MIVSDLKHIEQQINMTPALAKAVEFLRLRGTHDLPDGRIELDGENVFAIVSRYETIQTDAPKFEYHRKYIDVQYIASGEEVIGWAPIDRMAVTEAYDTDKDICFGAVEPGKWSPVYLKAGELAVFYPQDGHAPRLACGVRSSVMKIVVKVAA